MAQKAYDSERQDYKTPPEIYKKLLELACVNRFDIDVCCSEDNIPAKWHFYESLYDGLIEGWFGKCFLNPPFKYTQKWLKKAIKSITEKSGIEIFAVIPADRLETKYYQDYILNNPHCAFCFLPKKIGFIIPGREKEKPKPSQKIMIAIFCSDELKASCYAGAVWGLGYKFNTVSFKGGGNTQWIYTK